MFSFSCFRFTRERKRRKFFHFYFPSWDSSKKARGGSLVAEPIAAPKFVLRNSPGVSGKSLVKRLRLHGCAKRPRQSACHIYIGARGGSQNFFRLPTSLFTVGTRARTSTCYPIASQRPPQKCKKYIYMICTQRKK